MADKIILTTSEQKVKTRDKNNDKKLKCCHSGCEDCPFPDFSFSVDPTIPIEFQLENLYSQDSQDSQENQQTQ